MLDLLHLEDDPSVCDLAELIPAPRGFAAPVRRVAAKHELIAALAERTPDAIVANPALSSFAFGDALELIRATLPDVPVVLFGGRIGEERVAALVRAGVADYVPTDNPARLASAIEQAAREASDLRETGYLDEIGRLFLDYAPVSMAMFDTAMRYVAISQYSIDLYGLNRSEIIGQSHYEIFPNIPQRWKDMHQRGLAGETIRVEADRLFRRDGRELWLSWEIKPWYGRDGGLGGIIMYSNDITARRQLEEELERHHRHLEAVVDERTRELQAANDHLTMTQLAMDRVGIGIQWVDPATGRILDANRASASFFGLDIEELKRRTVFDVRRGSTPEAFRQIVTQLREQQSLNYETIIFANNGRKTPVEVMLYYLGDAPEPRVISFVTDISQRKAVEGALAESERFLRSVTDVSMGMLGYWDTDLRNRFANKAYVDWFGLTPGQCKGLHVADVIGHSQFVGIEEHLRAALNGVPQQFERTVTKLDGSVRHIWVTYDPDVVDGEVRGFVSHSSDVTAIKQAQVEVARLAAEYADLYNCAPCGYHTLAPDGTVLQMNDTELAWLGVRREDVIGKKHITEFLSERSRQLFAQNFPDVLAVGRLDELEMEMRAANGRSLPVLISATAVRNDEGRISSVRSVVLDNSQLRQEQDTLRQVLKAAPIAVRVASLLDDRVLFTNKAFGELVHRGEASDARQIDIRSCYKDPQIFDAIRARLCRGEAVLNQVIELFLPERTDLPSAWAFGSYMPIQYDDQPASLAWLYDISELQRGKLAAEEAMQVKSHFLANMSHEIRTPLNAVLGLSQMLEHGDLSPDAIEIVKKIHKAGATLLDLVNDILDFSKIESAKLEIEHIPFCIADVLDGVGAIMATQAAAKRIGFFIDPPPAECDGLYGDARRLRQILINLASNAIKFTSVGEVHITVATDDADDGRVQLRFSVRDTGIGIPENKQQEIFLAFTQADSTTTRRFGGTGLGLAICKQLVGLMGGEIGVESAPGKGSEFWFIVPLERSVEGGEVAGGAEPVDASLSLRDHETGSARVKWPLHGMHVLVVDDSKTNRELMVGILQHEGANVSLANDGQDALDWLHHNPDRADVVLMDVQMPVLDGLAATRALRMRPEWATLPVIAMTAGVLESQREAALSAGMNDFIAKPFDLEKAIAILVHRTRWDARPVSSARAGPATTKTDPASMTGNALPGLAVGKAMAIWREAPVYHHHLRKFARDYAGACDLLLGGRSQRSSVLLHKIRGVAGNLGLVDVVRTAAALEAVGDNGRNWDAEVEQFRAAMAVARHSIERHAGPPATLAPDSGGPGQAREAVPTAEIRRMLDHALAACQTDNPGAVEPLIGALARVLPGQAIERLSAAIEDFDFREAEGTIRELAAGLEDAAGGREC